MLLWPRKAHTHPSQGSFRKVGVMTKARFLSLSTFLALAVVLTYGAAAQQAAKVQPASQAKPAAATPAKAAGPVLPKVAKVTVNDPVTLTDNGDTWTLDNGIIKATILKKIGSLQQVAYHGVETLRPSFQTGGDVYHTPQTPMGSQIPTWEQIPSGTVTPSVTIDPAKNGGERAEVAVKGVNNGRMDIELRYTLERGQSGFYAYAEFSHPASYPAAHVGESQFDVQLNPNFNWFTVDSDRMMFTPSGEDVRNGVVIHAKEQTIQETGFYKNSVEHKYTYSGIMYRHPDLALAKRIP